MITLDKEISHQFYSNSRNHPPTTIKGENEPFQLLLLLYFLVFPSLLLRSFHTQNILKGSVSLPNFCSVIPSPGLRLLLLLLSIRWYSNLYHTEQWPHCDTMRTTVFGGQNCGSRNPKPSLRRVQKIPRKPRKRPTIRLGNDNSNPTTRTT